MDKVKRFFELKELWKRSNEAERSKVDEDINTLLNSMNEKEMEQLEVGVSADFQRIHKETKEINEILTIRQQMDNILPVISVSYLAKHYFGKSTSWFYQRLNGNKVHGKICKFTKEEIETLNKALKDIVRMIDDTLLKLN